MNDLIRKTGVTRTAITEQVNELIEAGFVEQTIERFKGRGRPRFLYSATSMALKQLFEGNQDVVVPAIWKALRRYCNPETVMKICDDVAVDIANQFTPHIESTCPKERMRKFHDIICKSPRLSHIKDSGNEVSVSKLSCPFVSMYDESGTICMIDQLAMSKIIGPGVQRTCHRHQGGTCCTYTVSDDFQPVPDNLPVEVLAD